MMGKFFLITGIFGAIGLFFMGQLIVSAVSLLQGILLNVLLSAAAATLTHLRMLNINLEKLVKEK